MNLVNSIKRKINHVCIRTFKFPKILKRGRQYKVATVIQTINSLINSNKSLSRFGDGELEMITDKNHIKDPSNDVFKYEQQSMLIRSKLIKVLTSMNPNLEIGLTPLNAAEDHNYNVVSRRNLKLTMCGLGTSWMNYLNKNIQYYNTDMTRSYSLYKKYSYSKYLFHQLKKIWENKNVLIVEGQGTRLGVGNDLLKNAKSIHRIECPSANAFESYSKIFNAVSSYLRSNKYIDLSLLALGPSATILAYDLSNEKFRAIDIGHVDMEYEWFLKNKAYNIPYKYVNEIPGGQHIIPIHNDKYYEEIVKYIV